MTNLSPQAQAVLDAFDIASDGHYDDGVWVPHVRKQLAAALVAAADQVVPEQPMFVEGGRTHKDAWTANVREHIRNRLLAIAAELRGQDQQHTKQEDYE